MRGRENIDEMLTFEKHNLLHLRLFLQFMQFMGVVVFKLYSNIRKAIYLVSFIGDKSVIYCFFTLVYFESIRAEVILVLSDTLNF